MPIIQKCFLCDFRRASTLFTNKCLQKIDHKGVEKQQLVCRCSRMNRLVAIKPLPKNKDKMRGMNRKYTFLHSDANCEMSRGDCFFPHSYIEEEAWNLLLYEAAPQLEVGTVN